jgi:hypothetical protein
MVWNLLKVTMFDNQTWYTFSTTLARSYTTSEWSLAHATTRNLRHDLTSYHTFHIFPPDYTCIFVLRLKPVGEHESQLLAILAYVLAKIPALCWAFQIYCMLVQLLFVYLFLSTRTYPCFLPQYCTRRVNTFPVTDTYIVFLIFIIITLNLQRITDYNCSLWQVWSWRFHGGDIPYAQFHG